MRATSDRFVWDVIRSPGHLRLETLGRFLADFSSGIVEDRHRTNELPRFAFEDGAFDLVLCSHVLFLYSDPFSTDLHLATTEEMCRVAGEARVFP